MKHSPAPPISSETVETVRKAVDEGATPDELIQKMRAAGLSIIPSIRLLGSFFNIPAGDAKRMVHLSRTRADALAVNDDLHETAYRVAKEEGFEIVEVEEAVASATR